MNEIKSTTPEKRGEIAVRIVVGAALVGAAIVVAGVGDPKIPPYVGD